MPVPEQQRDVAVGLVLLGVVEKHRQFKFAAVYARPIEEFNIEADNARGIEPRQLITVTQSLVPGPCRWTGRAAWQQRMKGM